MKVLDVEAAIEELAYTLLRYEAEGKAATDAFFWLVGAGISVPQIPLAGDIVRRCQAILRLDEERMRIAASSVPERPSARYAHWFEHALPQPSQRQDLLRELIAGQPISPANLRLAHLLSSPLLPHLVVTTNFDDLLAQALHTFGLPCIVADHPATAGRIDPENDGDVQILHVHGTYQFYDCCNLVGEVSSRAAEMGPRLDHVLERRSPIVLGYAGWEDDVFMRALERRLGSTRQVPNNVYWFCHRREELDALPAFLRDRENVRLVAPPASPEGGTLDAAAVLRGLIQRLRISPPALTTNPIAFFAERLRATLPVSEEAGPTPQVPDMYQLRPIVEKLEALAETWDEAPAREPDTRIEELQGLLRRSAYAEALEAAEALVKRGKLSEREVEELLEAAYLIGSELAGSQEEIHAYDVAARAVSGLEARGLSLYSDDPAVHVAVALVYKGKGLANQGRGEEAIAVFDEVIELYGKHADPDVREQAVIAATERAGLLAMRDGADAAVDALGEVARRYAEDEDLAGISAVALVRQGSLLVELKRYKPAVRAFNAALERFATNVPPDDVRHQQVIAFVSAGWALSRLGSHELAIKAYDRAIERFGDDVGFEQEISLALLNKSWSLKALDRNDEVVDVAEDLIAYYEEDRDPVVQHHVALARFEKAHAKAALGHHEQAIDLYRELVSAYDGSDDHHIRLWVASALAETAIIHNARGRHRKAVEACDELAKRIGDDHEYAPWRAIELLERGDALTALADEAEQAGTDGAGAGAALRTEAFARYDELIDRFGERAETDPRVRPTVVGGLHNRAVELAALGREEEAASSFERAAQLAERDPALPRGAKAARKALEALLAEQRDGAEDDDDVPAPAAP
ncbi:MAG: SIR2 family protein [Conexibacter sp.]